MPNRWRQWHAQLVCEHWVLDKPSLSKMVGIYDLLGTLNEPVSRLSSFNGKESESKQRHEQ